MARYLILDKDNKVINAIEWDGVTRFDPPRDHILLQELQKGNSGDTFDGKDFIPLIIDPQIDRFAEEIKTIDEDASTIGVFQRFISALRNELGI